MTEKKRNPLIEPYDHFKGYQKSIEKLKNNPEYVEFDKMCYELFYLNETGTHFMEFVLETYLLPSLVPKGTPDYAMASVWAEWFKEAFRMIRHGVVSHLQRIKAETNK
jgi:hypothetical protein